MLAIKLLGQFSVMLDGRLVEIPSRPAQLLLANLLLNAGSPQPREVLAGLLWPDSSSENARANLRHALWQLRPAIDPAGDTRADYIVHTPHDITFNRQSAYTFDVDILQCERPNWTTEALMDAAVAYGGELLPGFYESWVVLERARLAVVFDRRMTRLLDQLIDERRWDDALAWAARWMTLEVAPEHAYRAMMRAYGALGDSGRVVAAYEQCRDVLLAELGVEPSPETRRLAESLVRFAPSGPPFLGDHPDFAGRDHVAHRIAARKPVSGTRPAPVATPIAIEWRRAGPYRLVLGLAAVVVAVDITLAGRRRAGRAQDRHVGIRNRVSRKKLGF